MWIDVAVAVRQLKSPSTRIVQDCHICVQKRQEGVTKKERH
jgi:hypothetical protein